MPKKKKKNKVLIVSFEDKHADLYVHPDVCTSEKDIHESSMPKKTYKIMKKTASKGGGLTIELQPISKKARKKELEGLADQLKEYLDSRKLMMDVLEELPERDLAELKERLAKKPKIKHKKGCYKMMIGGKRGAPFELDIR